MKAFFLLFVLALPAVVFCQSYDELDSASKAKVDSIILRMSLIKQSQSHNKMVSFSEWDLGGLNDFWSYLTYDLNYKTKQPNNEINLKPTKSGYSAALFKSYPKVESMRIDFTCDNDGSHITETKIIAPFSALVELYIKYFGGIAKDYFPKNGGIDKMYTVTDEVRLYVDGIIIRPHKKVLSFD